MSIDTVLTQLGLHRHDPHSLEAQLHAMRRDVQHLRNVLSRQAGHTAADWGGHMHDMGTLAATHANEFAHAAGKQAIRSARIVGRDPLPAIAIAGTALLLLRLFRR